MDDLMNKEDVNDHFFQIDLIKFNQCRVLTFSMQQHEVFKEGRKMFIEYTGYKVPYKRIGQVEICNKKAFVFGIEFKS